MRARHLALVCDSGPGIGSGHLVRQLSVATEWARVGGSVSLTTPSALPPWLSDRFRQANVSMTDKPPSAADIVLYDSYRLDLEHVAQATVGALTVVTDDFCQLLTHPSTVVLDHNVGATPATYQGCDPSTRLLVGSAYTLVRPEFVSALARRLENQRADGPIRILIVLGGDPDRASLDDLQSSIRRRLPEAEQLLADGSVSDMAQFMDQADFAVSASGSTVYELCALGIPSIVIPIVENQRQIADALQTAGAAVRSTLTEAAADLALLVLDQQRSEALSTNAKALIDGQGARRVVSELRGMLNTADEHPPSSN